MVGPFVFLDHMGPVDFPPGIPRSKDVRPHPHIGLSTLTYLFAGEIMHRDSVGSRQPIRPGEVNWMTAGRGITHSERFERARREGGAMNGIQAWIALPREHEEDEPSFSHHSATALPELDKGLRLIAGEAFGKRSPVPVHSPLFYIRAELEAGATVELPDYPERAAYVVSGALEDVPAGTLAVYAKGPAALTAREKTTLMLLGGEPLGERFIDWNFVSSSKERIRQAKDDWRARRFPPPIDDTEEFIPLPPDPGAPANAMS